VACIDTAAPTFDVPARVAAITIQPAKATTNVGKQLPLSALALDTAGHQLDDQDIIWTSADTSVATVSGTGEVMAKRIGSTVITATNGTKTGTATLTVLAPQVASVALSPASASLLSGDTVRFGAEPRDDEAQPIDGRNVIWSIANPAIAKVAGGVLVGLAAGTTVVVATADGVSDSATVVISARPVESVSIVPGTVTLTSGKTMLLGTTALDDRGKPVEDKVVAWSSDDEKVATVSSTGVVSALSTGTATITASVTVTGNNGKGKTGKGQVKVGSGEAPVASVAVSPATATVITGATQQLTATPKDSDGAALGGRTITWASSNSAVATVTSSGLVTAVAAGKATITATSEDKSGSSAITVTLPPVASVSLSPGSAQLLVGKSTTLAASTLDANGKTLTGRTITWSSGKSSVATVSSSGVVTGAAAGSAWIFAASEGQKDSASISVTLPPVASVSVSPASTSLLVGDTKALAVTLKDASGATLTGRSVTWVSSDKAVATVSSAGLVTAVGAGSATMTAASEGESGTASITVTAPEPSDSEPPTTSDPAPSGGTDSGPHSGYFVSPSGSSGASGSESSPLSLSAALSGGNGKISAGDTVWLRQGTYSGDFLTSLSGSSSAPIVFRQYPGERATINGTLTAMGSNVWFWGFEVANKNSGEQSTAGITSKCSGCRFINMVIHDHSSNGLQMWSEGPNQEAYGNIIYNNGFYGQSSDHAAHGIYAQNQSGTQKILDNLLFNQYGYGIHIYGSDQAYLNNYTISGNAAVNSGIGAQAGMSGGMDYQIGGGVPLVNLVFTNNMSYRSSSMREDYTARVGYNWGPMNYGGTITSNYFVGPWILVNWSSSTTTGNPILDGAMPSGTKVVVEPNKYESGRANVIIYNWGHQGAVSVDLSKVLGSGQGYEVRNAQNFYGSPVASGTYNGGTVSIPITSITPPASVGGRATPVSTGTEFNAYVIVKK
jgi:uncharacterized protein YjdB